MEKYADLDKMFLLIYTCIGFDGMRHSRHAWFLTEEKMKSFVMTNRESRAGFEIELSLEILSYRTVVF